MDLSEQEVAALLHSATHGNDIPLQTALQHFGDIDSLLNASEQDWCACRALSQRWRLTFKAVIARIETGRLQEHERRVVGSLRDLGVDVLLPSNAAYPALLHHIPDPPALLYRRGSWCDLNTPQVAMVGARRASIQAQKLAHTCARELAACGLVITSGMAVGIDACSHAGALESGHTIAVLGSGIDQLYPARNRRLAQQILKQGCLVSDHPIATNPTKYTFPKRNRLVSGLSRMVIVVEAARRSGSLVTARHALEQNKELMVYPWSAAHTQGLGCLDLLADGAGLIRDVTDVWLALAQTDLAIELKPGSVINSDLTLDLSTECQRLLQLLGDSPVSSWELSRQLKQPIARVQEHLSELELARRIAVSGTGYVRL